MKKILFLTAFIFPLLALAQQPLCGIRGIVTVKTTGESIPFLQVSMMGADSVQLGTVTDVNGFYEFKNRQPGWYTLHFSGIDFISKDQRVELIAGQESLLLNVQVEEAVQMLEEVMILNSAPGVISANRMSAISVTRISGNSRKVKHNYAQPNTESYDEFTESPFRDVRQVPRSTFSIDVDRASYSNVRRFIQGGNLPPRDAVRIEEMLNYFSYAYPAPTGDDPFAVHTEFTECPWNPAHRLLHIGMQGRKVDMQQAPASNLVFLVDVSGSMQSPDKLDLLKAGLYLLVDQLREQDRVAIVVYAGAAGMVLPPTSGSKKETIKKVIEELTAGGATAGAEGIELAYNIAQQQFIAGGTNRVILATDGDFNLGLSDDGALIRLIEQKRESQVYLTVLGFGTGNLKDSKMEKLADKGNGNYAYIDNLLEAKKVLVSELGGTLLTIAKDVKLQLEFNPANVKAYRLIGYENRALNDEDFNNDSKDAGDLGSGHSVTAIYELIPAGSEETLPAVDELKYQQTATTAPAVLNGELVTVKVRCKRPGEVKSKLTSIVVRNELTPLQNTSDDCRFAAAVAEFGLLVRGSSFAASASFDQVIALAQRAKGQDDQGYRAAFIQLAETAAKISR